MTHQLDPDHRSSRAILLATLLLRHGRDYDDIADSPASRPPFSN